jgi:hypothetical protein
MLTKEDKIQDAIINWIGVISVVGSVFGISYLTYLIKGAI